MASEALIKVVEQQEILDRLSDQIQPLVQDAFKSAGPAGREVKNILHGTWLGHPLHPALTDVPLGAWTAAFALDAMESISGRRELGRSEEHTSELQSRRDLVCRLLLEKKNKPPYLLNLCAF